VSNQIYKVCGPGYVAAILQGTHRLHLWLMGVAKSRMDKLVIHSMTGAESYPFDLVECKKDGEVFFTHCKIEDTENHIKTMKACYCQVLATYRITQDFYGDPKRPGEDYMGMLDHKHEDV